MPRPVREIRAVEDTQPVAVIVLDEVNEEVPVTEDVEVRDCAEEAEPVGDRVLVEVGFGAPVTVELAVVFAVDVPDREPVGQDEVDPVSV